MLREKRSQKTLEDRIEDLTISSSNANNKATETISPPPPKVSDQQDLTWLRNVICNRESFDAIVTKHIFDKLKTGGISKEQIVELLVETNCPLDYALLMENVEVIRMLLERKKEISNKESCLLIELAMRVPYLENIKVVVRYGPGAEARRTMFSTQMFDLINNPCANLAMAKPYIEHLMIAEVIDEYTLQFLENTFEFGKEEPIKMLLDCKVSEYVKRKCGEDLYVHLFANDNLDMVQFLRGRRFNVNAKCGEMAALHFATFKRLERNVRILLNAGADPNVRDCHGMTPLFAFGDEKCITLLLQNGGDVQAIADNGYTVLHMIFHPSLLGIMLAHIVLIEARGTPIKTEIRNQIISNSVFVDFYDKACKQLEDMKEFRIHEHFTLWTALVCRPEVISRFVDSQQTIDKLTCECRNLQIHPYYLSTLEKHFNKAFTMYGLKCKADENILTIFKVFGINEMIVKRIVNYMTFEDLVWFA